jgi:outer membrane receptor protein involved in Fe transport
MDLSAGLFGSDGSNLSFRLNGTWTDKWDYTPVKGLDIVNECAGAFGRNCGAPLPEWGHSFRTTWATGPMDVSMLWRYIGSTTDDDPDTLYAREEFSSANYFDFTFGWEFMEGLKLNLGVDNAFNEKPELGASTQQGGNVEQSNTYPTVYDVIGRYYWATLNVKF